MGWRPILVVLLMSVSACVSDPLVAPDGAILSISANPTEISVTGASNITLTAIEADGSPVTRGTEIILTATLGSIPEIVRTDDRGIAHAVLSATGMAGEATVTAASGAATPVSLDVRVGFVVAGLTLRATPTVVGSTGGSVSLVAIVEDDRRQRLGGAAVTFTTTAGRLDSSGAVRRTDPGGELRDVLHVSAAEARPLRGQTVTVTVAASSGGSAQETSIGVPISR